LRGLNTVGDRGKSDRTPLFEVEPNATKDYKRDSTTLHKQNSVYNIDFKVNSKV